MCVVYRKQEKYDKALETYKHALDLYTRTLGWNHVNVASTRVEKGMLHWRLGQHEDALAEYTSALEIYMAKFGKKHTTVR